MHYFKEVSQSMIVSELIKTRMEVFNDEISIRVIREIVEGRNGNELKRDGLLVNKNVIPGSSLFSQNNKKYAYNRYDSYTNFKKLDNTALPYLFMRTVIITLKNFPNTKDFIIEQLIKCVQKRKIVTGNLFDGFCICLKNLNTNCMEILLRCDEKMIRQIFEKNKAIVKLCDQYLKNVNISGRKVILMKRLIKDDYRY